MYEHREVRPKPFPQGKSVLWSVANEMHNRCFHAVCAATLANSRVREMLIKLAPGSLAAGLRCCRVWASKTTPQSYGDVRAPSLSSGRQHLWSSTLHIKARPDEFWLTSFMSCLLCIVIPPQTRGHWCFFFFHGGVHYCDPHACSLLLQNKSSAVVTMRHSQQAWPMPPHPWSKQSWVGIISMSSRKCIQKKGEKMTQAAPGFHFWRDKMM